MPRATIDRTTPKQTVVTSVRLESQLFDRVRAAARKSERSVTAVIRVAVRAYLDAEGR